MRASFSFPVDTHIRLARRYNPGMNLLERDTYLQQLHEVLRRVQEEGGEIVFLAGEGGIGKTALIEQFLRDLPAGVGYSVVSCDGLGVPGPFGALFDIADALGPDVASLLQAQASREQIFRAVLGAFRAAPGAMVMVGEDAHWTDEATLELIRFLGRRIRSTHALVIIAYRDDQLGPYHPLRRVLGDLSNAPGVHRMELPPLSREAVGSLVARAGIDAEQVYALTEGNPFLITEIVDSGSTGVPVTVMDAVLARASRLSPEAQAVLDAAATIGMTVDPALLSAVIGGPIEDAIDECLAVGMLRERDDVIGFRHGISRYAVLDSMSSARRRALHQRVLEVLQRGPIDERQLGHLAFHAEEAGDVVATLRFAFEAARRAAAFGAHREAALQYARGLRFAAHLPDLERVLLMEAHAYECYLTGNLDEAITRQQEAISLSRTACDRLREGNGLRWLSRFFWFSGRTPAAFEAAEASREILEGLSPGPELGMAWSNLALLHMSAWDIVSTSEWSTRAIALADELGRTEIRIHAMSTIATARYANSDRDGLASLLEVARLGREHRREDDVTRALTNAALIAWLQQDLAVAEQLLDEALAWADERDLVAMALFQRALQAAVWVDRGRWEAAVAQAESVARLPATIVPARIMALAALGRARAVQGEDPWVVLDHARALAIGTGEMQRLLPVTLARAEAAWLEGDTSRVAGEIQSLVDHDVTRRNPWIAGQLGLWLTRAGQAVDPAGLARRHALEIGGMGAEAAALWEEMGYPLEAIRARASSGRIEDLRAAIHAFERLGAVADAVRVTRVLRARGERHIPRGPRAATRANAAHLTARELEVLGLLLEGATNREIADRLFLSAKTAGHHVSSILAKLEVSTRREAVARAHELGIVKDRESGNGK